MDVTYKVNELGYEFPVYGNELLSWSIDLYFTHKEEEKDFPRARVVIDAMMEKRPDQLERERRQLYRDSSDKMFGHNARKLLKVIDEEMDKNNADRR